MRNDLQQRLFDIFPELFARRHLDRQTSCMDGINVPDGWWQVMFDLADGIRYLNEDGISTVRFEQIKVKFGDLRVYYDPPDLDVHVEALTSIAVETARMTCMVCGMTSRERACPTH
jgi:hypothetical protein